MTGMTLPYVGAMADADYFAFDAWDQTQLKAWMVSPAQWAADRKDDAGTLAMRFGTAAHSLVLGSGAPVRRAEHTPRSKAGIAEAEKAAQEGVTLLSAADYEAVTRMARNARPFFEDLGGRPETAMVAVDPDTGLELKGKADWLPSKPDSDGVYWIYDYKTTSAPLEDFDRTAFQHGYHIQAAFYMRLWRLTHPGETRELGFRFVPQSKHDPYDYIQRSFHEDSPEIVAADRLITLTLEDIHAWRSARGDETPTVATGGLDHAPQDMSYSPWMFDQIDRQILRLGGEL